MFLFPFLGGKSQDRPRDYDDTPISDGDYDTSEEETVNPVFKSLEFSNSESIHKLLSPTTGGNPFTFDTSSVKGGSDSDTSSILGSDEDAEIKIEGGDSDSEVGELEIMSNADADDAADNMNIDTDFNIGVADTIADTSSDIGVADITDGSPNSDIDVIDTNVANIDKEGGNNSAVAISPEIHKVRIYTGFDILEDIKNSTKKGGSYNSGNDSEDSDEEITVIKI